MTDDVRPLCRYCLRTPMRARGVDLFPDHPVAAAGHFLHCRHCDAWVRCADGGWEPLGELGDRAVRNARRAAHEARERLVARTLEAGGRKDPAIRSAIDGWLVASGIEPRPIAGMERDDCVRVWSLCSPPAEGFAAHLRATDPKVSKRRRRRMRAQ